MRLSALPSISRLLLLALVVTACARSRKPPIAQVGDVALLSAYAHPSAGDAGAVYLTLRNDGTSPDTLREVSVPDSATSMLMTTSAGHMQMMPGLVLNGGETVAMIPGGIHVMFGGLKREFAIGDTMRVTLHFARAGSLEVKAVVLPFGDIPE